MSAKDSLIRNFLFIAMIAVIFSVGLAMRMSYSVFPWFLEPDGFYHYSIAFQTVENGGKVPVISALDGKTLGESFGMYLLPIYLTKTYFFDNLLHFSLLQTMRYLPILFFIIAFISFALIIRELTKNRFILFASLFILLFSTASMSRSSVGIYRGDAFLPAIVVVSLLFLIRAVKKNSIPYAILSGVLLVPAELVWNESGFIAPLLTRMAVFIGLSAYVVIKGGKKDLLKSLALVPVSLVGYLVVLYPTLFIPALAGEPKFTYTILLSIVMVIGMSAIIGIIWATQRISRKKALAFLISLYIIVAAIFLALTPLPIRSAGDSLQAIQETQAPNPVYLLSLFSVQLFMTPMTLLLFILSAFSTDLFLVWAVANLPILLYFLKPEPELIQDNEAVPATLGYITMMAFFSSMLFLTVSQIRFSSMLAIPLAFVAALTLWKVTKVKHIGKPIVILLLAFLFVFTLQSLMITTPADYINQQFLSALSWMKNNTPANSKVLTLWTDGSVVEGYADRFSYSDSVGALGEGLNSPFNRLMLTRVNQPVNATFIENVDNTTPDYLLVRQVWRFEAFGMATEAGLKNATQYENITTLNQSLEGTVMAQLLNGCKGCQGLTVVFNNSDTLIYQVRE